MIKQFLLFLLTEYREGVVAAAGERPLSLALDDLAFQILLTIHEHEQELRGDKDLLAEIDEVYTALADPGKTNNDTILFFGWVDELAFQLAQDILTPDADGSDLASILQGPVTHRRSDLRDFSYRLAWLIRSRLPTTLLKPLVNSLASTLGFVTPCFALGRSLFETDEEFFAEVELLLLTARGSYQYAKDEEPDRHFEAIAQFAAQLEQRIETIQIENSLPVYTNDLLAFEMRISKGRFLRSLDFARSLSALNRAAVTQLPLLNE